jgi:hypothetical protein
LLISFFFVLHAFGFLGVKVPGKREHEVTFDDVIPGFGNGIRAGITLEPAVLVQNIVYAKGQYTCFVFKGFELEAGMPQENIVVLVKSSGALAQVIIHFGIKQQTVFEKINV